MTIFKSGRVRHVGLILLAVLVLGAFAFVVARTGPLAPVRVTVTEAHAARIAPALFGIGTVEARRAFAIGPTQAARVLSVAVDVGDTVRAGEVLARMDPVDLDARLSALDAAIARARSAVATAAAQQRDAAARHDVARIEARRYVSLGAQDFVSASVVEARSQAQTSAQAAVAAARAANAGARAEVTRLQAEREALAEQRASLDLVAPADGIVTAREAEPGDTTVAGQAVLRLIDPGSLWVKTRIDQGRSGGLAAGLPAAIVLRADAHRRHAGRVARVELLSDSVTEERIAQVAFDSVPPGVTVGEMAEVTIDLAPVDAAVVVPNAAVRTVGETRGVWRVGGDTLLFVAVRTGASSLDGAVHIVDGLAAGDTVVVHAERDLNEDTNIRVVESLVGARP